MRITITDSENAFSPELATAYATQTIRFWSQRPAGSWSPGAIATYNYPTDPAQEVITSTRQTEAGWAVRLYLRPRSPEGAGS